MASYNKVILVGNLTRDPELRYTQKGMAIARLGVAVNRTWKDANTGENKEEVTFVDVDAFGKQAETLGNYMKKGRPLMIEGRLRLDTWEDKQTQQKRSKLGVVLESFQFLDFRGGEEGGGGAPRSRPTPPPAGSPPSSAAPAPPPAEHDEPPPPEDDVPF